MKPKSALIVIAVALVAAAFVFAAASAKPADAFPNKQKDCSDCHGPGTYGGTVTAIPSTATPTPGASYTVAITISQNPNGTFDTGYWIANSTVAGATGTTTGVYGGASGTNQQSYTATMTAPTGAGTYYYKVFGVDGDTSSLGQVNFAVYSITVGAQDNVAPTTTDNAPAPTVWNTGAVAVTLSAADNGGGSGVATTYYQIDMSPVQTGTVAVVGAPGKGSPTGVHALTYWSVDKAGNIESPKTKTVKIDVQAPFTGNNAPAGVQTGATVVTLSATDMRGSGVASTMYRLDGGGWTAGTTVNVPAANGVHVIEYYSTDAVGNVEVTRSCTVTVQLPAASVKVAKRGLRVS